MTTIHSDAHTFKNAVTFASTVLFSTDGGVTTTTAAPPGLKYVSSEITLEGVASGQTATYDLTNEVAGWIPEHVWVHTSGAVASNSGDTTGVAVEVGVAADPDSYMATVSAFGAAGIKQGARGVSLAGLIRTDALQLKLTTAGGASSNVQHLTGFAAKVVILYQLPTTTYPT